MPGVGMLFVIVGAMFLTGAVAFYIARNVEHGEARFGPEGPLPPFEGPKQDPAATKVTINRDEGDAD